MPFIIMLGIVTLSVPWKEFSLFSRVIEEAVSDEVGIPQLAAKLAMRETGREG